MGALRLHLVPPSQEMPHTLLDVFIEHLVGLRWAPPSEIRFPALQLLIQPIAHFFPGRYIAGPQMLCHFLPDPVHTLLRRAAAYVLSSRSPAEVRSEGITQKVESLLTGVTNARLLFVECQSQPFQHSARPLQLRHSSEVTRLCFPRMT